MKERDYRKLINAFAFFLSLLFLVFTACLSCYVRTHSSLAVSAAFCVLLPIVLRFPRQLFSIFLWGFCCLLLLLFFRFPKENLTIAALLSLSYLLATFCMIHLLPEVFSSLYEWIKKRLQRSLRENKAVKTLLLNQAGQRAFAEKTFSSRSFHFKAMQRPVEKGMEEGWRQRCDEAQIALGFAKQREQELVEQLCLLEAEKKKAQEELAKAVYEKKEQSPGLSKTSPSKIEKQKVLLAALKKECKQHLVELKRAHKKLEEKDKELEQARLALFRMQEKVQ